MVTREDVVAEIQKVPDEHLEALYLIIKNFEEQNGKDESNQNVMAALRRIKITASPDFSIKAKLYDLEERDAR